MVYYAYYYLRSRKKVIDEQPTGSKNLGAVEAAALALGPGTTQLLGLIVSQSHDGCRECNLNKHAEAHIKYNLLLYSYSRHHFM